MKVAIISSGSVPVSDIRDYIPPGATEIISISEASMSEPAKGYLKEHGIELTEYKIEAEGNNKNKGQHIAEISKADTILAFWDGKSTMTKKLIDRARGIGLPIKVFV